MDKRCDNEGAVEAQLELAKALDGCGESAAGNGSTEQGEIMSDYEHNENDLTMREEEDLTDLLQDKSEDNKYKILVEHVEALEADNAALEARIKTIKVGVDKIRESVGRTKGMWIYDEVLGGCIEATIDALEGIEK